MSEKNTEIVSGESSTALAPVNSSFTLDAEDIDIPRLNVVQKMSDSDAPNGSLVFDKKFVIAPEGVSVRAVAVAAQKGWREDIPFDEEEIPKMAWSKDEAAGLASESEWDLVEFAELTFLIEQPEDCGDDEAFQLPLGDKNYCLGKMNVAKNAYRSTYKRIVTFAKLNPKANIQSKVWNLMSESITRGKYTWNNPTLTATKDLASDEVLEFVSSFNG